jgi:hypothetical protein
MLASGRVRSDKGEVTARTARAARMSAPCHRRTALAASRRQKNLGKLHSVALISWTEGHMGNVGHALRPLFSNSIPQRPYPWEAIMGLRFGLVMATLAVIGALLTGLSAAEDGRVALSGPELTTLLSGNTETWSTVGAGYYDPAGVIEYVWKGEPNSGQWKITGDGVLCLKIIVWYGDDFNCNWSYFREHGDVFSLNLKSGTATRMPGFAPGKTF